MYLGLGDSLLGSSCHTIGCQGLGPHCHPTRLGSRAGRKLHRKLPSCADRAYESEHRCFWDRNMSRMYCSTCISQLLLHKKSLRTINTDYSTPSSFLESGIWGALLSFWPSLSLASHQLGPPLRKVHRDKGLHASLAPGGRGLTSRGPLHRVLAGSHSWQLSAEQLGRKSRQSPQ